ncbi:MAG: exodeoxyribonuclease VII large subunit [Candidatus Wallbacteria bacterium]|nr:exodeoxyribonuclease VII large subunit [Candidatus Wallbacteria bacterium]
MNGNNDQPITDAEDKPFNPNIETVCPSCGRFSGTYDRCPYCGREVHKRLSIRIVKLSALGMAFIGLFFLFFAAWNKQLPLVKVAEIQPTMNFAYVRVKGTAVSDAFVYEYGGLNFNLNDSPDGKAMNSNISVRAYSNIAAELQKRKLLPSQGDIVEVAGSIKIRDGGVSMIIQSPDQVSIIPRLVKTAWINEITEAMLNDRVRITAQITEVTPARGNAPREIRISDQSGAATLVMWKSVFESLNRLPGFGKEAEIEAEITVDQYRGKLQLWVKNETHVKVTKEAEEAGGEPTGPAQPMSLASVTGSMTGRLVKIQGKIASFNVTPGKAPNQIEVVDSSGSGRIDLWKNVYSQVMNTSGIGIGAQIEATVKIEEYQGKMQLFLLFAKNLRIMGNAPGAEHKPIKLKDIKLDGAGSVVQTEATVAGIERFGTKNNFKVFLEDEGTRVESIFFSSTFPELPPVVKPGSRVRITGKINNYRETLQIIVDKHADVEGL